MNSSTLILSTKRFLITSVAIAIILKLCAPTASLSEIAAMWSAILSWLEPPYLYIVINCIIITIAASSRLHVPTSEPSVEISTHPPLPPPPSSVFSTLPPEMVVGSSDGAVEESTDEVEDEDEEEKDKIVLVEGEVVTTAIIEDEDESTLSSFYDAPPMQEIISRKLTESTVREKPLVSTRFGHRRPIRTSLHEAAALRVARPKTQETLESTWKMVTEGRHVPLTRHLKTKSERWEHVKPDIGHVPKSETFKERTSGGNYNTATTTAMNRVNGKIRKEPSLGQDELNRRVEAFIKKFNEEMRIQRQESLNRFMEMINRGV